MTAAANAPALGARVLRSAARGAVLVGVAIIVGVVLLQVVNGAGAPSSGSGAKVASSTTSTSGGTTTSTGKPANQVKVAVLNGSAVSGAANTTANKLRGLGYAIVAVTNAPAVQTGTTVTCKTGFSGQTDTLAKNIASTAQVSLFPNPEPAAAQSADCIVTIGK